MRGAPPSEVVFGPRRDAMTTIVTSDCTQFAPRGVLGGEDGIRSASYRVSADGTEERLPNVFQVELQPGEWLRGHESSGGGYGDPFERDPQRVLHDVLEGWETIERARDVYGVVLTGDAREETIAIDATATVAHRAARRR